MAPAWSVRVTSRVWSLWLRDSVTVSPHTGVFCNVGEIQRGASPACGVALWYHSPPQSYIYNRMN